MVKFDKNTLELNVPTPASKRAKVSDDEESLLSRAEVAKLKGIKNALDRTQEALVNFASWDNGK